MHLCLPSIAAKGWTEMEYMIQLSSSQQSQYLPVWCILANRILPYIAVAAFLPKMHWLFLHPASALRPEGRAGNAPWNPGCNSMLCSF